MSLDEVNSNPVVDLVDDSGARHPIKRRALQQSTFLNNLLSDHPECDEIPISHISEETLSRVVKYLDYHMRVPPVVIPTPLPDMIPERPTLLTNNEGKTTIATRSTAPTEESTRVSSGPLPTTTVGPSPTVPANTMPSYGYTFRDIVGDFDAKLVDITHMQLFELLLTASYLQIPTLRSLILAKIASLMKGKSPLEVKRTFGIRTDTTAEEESTILTEYSTLFQ